MGFLRRLFGRATAAPEPAAPLVRALMFEPDDAAHIDYDVDVVGESFYQPALDEIAGGRTTEGCVKREHVAALVPEPQNPYDKQAVAVLIEGRLVGHLSREDARAYAVVIRRCRDADRYPAVRATLTGGWDRGADDHAHIGVKLALGKPASMLAALAEKARTITGFRGQILWDTIPRRPLDIQVLYGDSAKAKSVLGWEAKVSLDEGLRRTSDFWRKKLSDSERATRATTT